MAEEVGTAYVRLLPSMRGFRKAAQKALSGEMDQPARKAGKDAGEEAERGFSERLAERMPGVAKRVLKVFGGALTVGNKGLAYTAATAFSTTFLGQLAHGLAAGLGKVVRGLGAAVALAPAAITAGAVALGTLRIALLGVADALEAGLAGDTEKFQEALKGLAPAARSVVREVVGLKGRFDDLKGTVQQALFEPLIGQVRRVGIYLDQARIVMGRIGNTAGEALAGIARWLVVPAIARQIFAALTNAQMAVQNITRGLGGLVAAFLPLVVVGSRFLPFLTNGFAEATLRLAAFMQEAQRTGELHAFIQRGIDSIRSLIDTGRQVWRIFGDIRDIARVAFAGINLPAGHLLDTLERATERARAFVRTAEGAEIIRQIFATAAAVGNVVFGTLQTLGQILAPLLPEILQLVEAFALFKGGIIAGAVQGVQMLADVIGPLMPQIIGFANAMNRLAAAVIQVGLETLAPILSVVGAILGTVVLPALTALANWLASNETAIRVLGGVILTLLIPAFVAWSTQVIRSGLDTARSVKDAATAVGRGARTAANGVGRLIDGFRNAQAAESAFSGRLGTLGGKLRTATNAAGRFASSIGRGMVRAGQAMGRLAVQAATAAARVTMAFLRMAAQAAMATARVVAQIAIQVARWVFLGIQSLLAAAKVALAWIISMGPIALVIAAVVALVALIIANWDKVVAATRAAFGFVTRVIQGAINWIKTNWPLLLAILTGPIGLAVLVISRNWDRIKAGARAVKDWIVARFRDVVRFVTSLPGRIGRAASGMWDGIKNAFRSAINWIIRAWNRIEFRIPGFDPPGPGPTFGGFTLGLPDIPTLAKGGIVRRQRGGVLARVAEGGEDEAVAPLDTLDSMIQDALGAVLGRAAAAPAAAPAEATIVLDVTGGDDELIRVVRKWIRTKGGGKVETLAGAR